MNFDEVTVSTPIVKYTVNVTHLTNRRSAVIEWMILECLLTIEKDEKAKPFANLSVAEFFAQMFSLTDSDLLIKPSIIELQRIKAISLDEGIYINDDTQLADIKMSNIHTTKEGAQLHSKGKLPGEIKENSFNTYYDVAKNSLLEGINKNNSSDTPKGIFSNENFSVENISFPLQVIKNDFEKKRKHDLNSKKGKKNFDWIEEDSEVSDFSPIDASLVWRNEQKNLILKDDMQCAIEGIEDESLFEKALDELNFVSSEDYPNIERVNIQNVDKEISRIAFASDLKSFIYGYLKNEDIFCIDNKIFEKNKFAEEKDFVGKTKPVIGLLFGCENFSVETILKGTLKFLKIHIPHQMKKGIVFQNKNGTELHLAELTLKAGSKTKTAPFVYMSAEKCDFEQICLDIINEFYENDFRVVSILKVLGKQYKDDITKILTVIIENKDTNDKKAVFVKEANEFSKEWFKENFIELSASSKTEIEIGKWKERLNVKIPELDFSKEYTEEALVEIINKLGENKNLLNEIKGNLGQLNKIFTEGKINDNTADIVEKLLSIMKTDKTQVEVKKEKSEYKNIYIIDTNILMESLDEFKTVFSNFKDTLVIFPTAVIEELDKHKIKNKEKAQPAIKFIDEIKDKNSFVAFENSHKENLPQELQNDSMDNLILSIAIENQKTTKAKVFLITNDTNFKTKAFSQQIKSKSINTLKNDIKTATGGKK